MTTKLTYNEFRSAHKGTAQKRFPNCGKNTRKALTPFPWMNQRPKQSKKTPVEESPLVEEVEEPTLNELCKEYDKLRVKMDKFAFKFVGDAMEKGQARLKELAELTRPKGYTCTPTDSWKIWFGPTSMCLLINTTNMMGFLESQESGGRRTTKPLSMSIESCCQTTTL